MGSPTPLQVDSAQASPRDTSSAPPLSEIDRYVDKVLRETTPRPPITWSNFHKEIRWFNLSVVAISPVIAFYGAFTTKLLTPTFAFATLYFIFSIIGITAGYHRLWSHRAYNASNSLQYFLAISGASSILGAIWWWARGHRSHHRFTDTDLDPYNAERGFLWSHLLWMLVKPRIKPGASDISDLKSNQVVQWQYRWYFPLAMFTGIFVPTFIPGYFWGDWRGGFYYAGFFRLVVVQHCVFSVNSVAHSLGEAPFDDKHTPRDHVLTAIVTLGEGYHNFHHQFPMDYRNAIKWYQFDPTKWFIAVCSWFGLATHLRRFPQGEVNKGLLTMEMKKLKRKQDRLNWPVSPSDLPVISWESFQEQSRSRSLVLVSGFIHDVSEFLDHHPGGRQILIAYNGKDATTAIFGGVYEHTNAAHNLLSMMRVGILHGGLEHVSEALIVPPAQRLRIIEQASTN